MVHYFQGDFEYLAILGALALENKSSHVPQEKLGVVGFMLEMTFQATESLATELAVLSFSKTVQFFLQPPRRSVAGLSSVIREPFFR
jgi:hypothetical protein